MLASATRTSPFPALSLPGRYKRKPPTFALRPTCSSIPPRPENGAMGDRQHANTSSTSIAPDSSTPPASSTPSFNWQRQWYPLVPISYLSPSAPHPFTVLNRKLVIWRHPESQQWLAFDDACPHRKAPLSEGRIATESSALQCAYHGWEFNAAGSCVGIPQIEDAPTAGFTRGCVARYPTTVSNGLLWVWMESGEGSADRAAAAGPALPHELRPSNKESGVLLGDWMMRELPISWDYLVENLVDPSHVHYAHHNVIGRRGKGKGLRVRVLPSTNNGANPPAAAATAGQPYAFSLEMTGNEVMAGRPSLTHFLPPSLVWLQFPVPFESTKSSSSPPSIGMLFYAVPVSPGNCRIIAGYSTNALPAAVGKAMASRIFFPMLHAVQWAVDLSAHDVLDGDTVLLRYQEERMAEQGESWRAYSMPAPADAGVVGFRRWVQKEGGGGPPGCVPEGPLKPLSRREILDRYEQHTKICPYCGPALRNVRASRSVLEFATSASFAGGFALAAMEAGSAAISGGASLRDPVRLGAALGLVGVGVGCGLLNLALQKLERRFVFTDYVHSEK